MSEQRDVITRNLAPAVDTPNMVFVQSKTVKRKETPNYLDLCLSSKNTGPHSNQYITAVDRLRVMSANRVDMSARSFRVHAHSTNVKTAARRQKLWKPTVAMMVILTPLAMVGMMMTTRYASLGDKQAAITSCILTCVCSLIALAPAFTNWLQTKIAENARDAVTITDRPIAIPNKRDSLVTPRACNEIASTLELNKVTTRDARLNAYAGWDADKIAHCSGKHDDSYDTLAMVVHMLNARRYIGGECDNYIDAAVNAIQSYDENDDASDELKDTIAGVIVYNYSTVMNRMSSFTEAYERHEARLARDEQEHNEIEQAHSEALDEFAQARWSIILDDAKDAHESNTRAREK